MIKRNLLLIIAVLLLAGCQEKTLDIVLTDVSGLHDDLLDHSNIPVGLDLGNLAPDFTITTIDNKQLELSSFSKDDKPVLVYFFATWCPFCKKDFDALSKVYNGYEDDVEIIAIDLDVKEDNDLISDYKSKFNGLEAVNFASGNIDLLALYKIKSTTTKYALKRDGTILYAGAGAINEDQWVTLLDALKAT